MMTYTPIVRSATSRSGGQGLAKWTFKRFSTTVSDRQRAEIRSRCAVIGSDGRFAQWARDMCVKVEAAQSSA